MCDLEKVAEEIKSRIEDLTHEERLDEIDKMHKKWIVSTNSENTEGNIGDILTSILSRFGMKLNSVNYKKFKSEQARELYELLYLKDFIRDSKDIKSTKCIIKLDEIFNLLTNIENTINSIVHLQDTILNTENVELPKNMELMLYSSENYSKNSPMQNLIIFISKCFKDDKLKRIGEACYAKVYTGEDTDELRYDTKTWKIRSSIEGYIYEKCPREFKFAMWQNLTSASVRIVADHLSKCADLNFTSIKKDRHVFSFNNGIYYSCHNYYTGMASNNLTSFTDAFIPYVRDKNAPSIKCDMPSNTTSCKYHKINFNSQYMEYEDPFDIITKHCPSLLSIMTYQGWDESIQRWLCILIGRCMYYVGMDNWQVIPFMLGQAGTGKSTIIMIVKMIYETMDVATLSNNMQTSFGMDLVSDKFLFVAPEVKENFKLDQSEFQSMVSGESMALNQKFKDTKNIDNWKVPGFMAGNELFGYKDTAGSIPRRVVVFMFSKKIKKEHSDPQLGNKLKMELPDIMLACNRLYLQAINKDGHKDIWSILPKYFLDNRDNLEESTNSLVKYFKSGELIVGTKYWIRENLLAEAYKEYCVKMNYSIQRWNSQLHMGPFDTFEIATKNGMRTVDSTGQVTVGTVYVGVDIRGAVHADLCKEGVWYDDGDGVYNYPYRENNNIKINFIEDTKM